MTHLLRRLIQVRKVGFQGVLKLAVNGDVISGKVSKQRIGKFVVCWFKSIKHVYKKGKMALARIYLISDTHLDQRLKFCSLLPP